MLELNDQMQRLVEIVGPLKCDVELPSSWKSNLDRTKPFPTWPGDKRRFRRYHFGDYAALQYCQTFPALHRPNTWYRIITKDVSRGGLSFLHGEQLFPRERMRVVFPEQGLVTIEIVWCARLEERCFQSGSRFVEQFHKLTA